MCEPATLSMIGIGMSVLSTGAGVMGQMQASSAASAQAGYQSAVARNNAIIAERLAVNAEERGKAAEMRQRTKTQQILGTQTAALASQGTDMSGSELDILGDTAAAGEMDVQTVRYNAAMDAWGYRARGLEYTAQANRPGPGDGLLGAGASLIAGGGAVADKWLKYDLLGGTRAPGSGTEW